MDSWHRLMVNTAMDMQTYALDTTWRILLADLKIRPADVLRRAGLAEDLLAQANTRLAPEAYYRLWDALEAELGDPLLPIRLCEALRSESFSPPLFAALCSPDLVTAARRVSLYKALIGPMRLQIEEADAQVTVRFEWLDRPLAPPVGLVMLELLFTATLARMGTREEIRPIAVTTTVLPSPAAPFETFLGCRIRRGTEHAVTFSAADARRPFLTSNEQLWQSFEPDLRRRLADLEGEANTTTRVRAALTEAIPSGLVGMGDVAQRLALSKRTLQRRIEAEGTSFQQILQAARTDLARHYLERTELPAAEISFLLGFEEPNSFYRAFRKWTGTTPDSVRQARRAA